MASIDFQHDGIRLEAIIGLPVELYAAERRPQRGAHDESGGRDPQVARQLEA